MSEKTPLKIKHFLPRTLFGRSLVILITPVLLIQIIASFVFFDRHWSKMTSRLAYAVAGEIAIIARSVQDDPDAENLERIIGFASQNLNLVVTFDEGAILRNYPKQKHFFFWETMVERTLTQELRNQITSPFSLNLDFQEKWIQISVQLTNGVLNVTLPQRRLFSSSGYIFLLWVIGTSLVLLIVAVIFMRNQIRPIRKLAAAAERFGKGRDVTTFKPQGAREVRQAGQAFLDMRRRIRRQIEQRTAMLAGVSHDLRTPLTRLKLQLAMLGDGPDVDAMKSDIVEMERMIAGYLDFVRGEGDEDAVEADLTALLEKAVTSAKRQGVNIYSQIEPDMTLVIKPLAFERCIGNIVSNAGKYAENVWLTAGRDQKSCQILIEDDGPGIEEDQYEEVFKPFYRVEQSRNTATGGVGLGLPIAMDIVHSHGGKIWLEKSGHGGLRVIIRLPL